MSGSNCAIVGCPCCRTRHIGLSFHRLPKKGKNDNWRNALISSLNRQDSSFNPNNATICSRHFTDACFKTGPSGQKRLRPGSLPTEYMPSKSVEVKKHVARKPPIQRPQPLVPTSVKYYSLEDLKLDFKKVTYPWFISENTPTRAVVGKVVSDGILIQVSISQELMVAVKVMGITAPGFSKCIEDVQLTSLLKEISNLKICQGVTDRDLQGYGHLPRGANESHYLHVTYREVEGSLIHETTVRSKKCVLLIPSNVSLCKNCVRTKYFIKRKQSKQANKNATTVKLHDPLKHMAKQKLVRAFKLARKREKLLRKKLFQFKSQMDTDSVGVSDKMHSSLKQVMQEATIDDQLTKMFWAEQLKAFKKKTNGMRWHPMMIRLAILLHSKSAAAYQTIRNTGILKLPGESTLRDYTNYIHPESGFNTLVLKEIQSFAKDFKDNQRYVVLLHDEMSVKADLVFDKRTGEMVGFTSLAGWSGAEEAIASHALVFYVVGVNTPLKFSLGFFGTESASAHELYPLLWQAIGYLETSCNLKVIASTSDKATPNQKLYQMHGEGDNLCYKTLNVFAGDRQVYFFSDVPHLIKTIRNNLQSSGAGKNTRLLWNNGSHILWKHIVDLYRKDMENVLHRTKLTSDHINLTPYSVMNVKLAAQVLSYSVGSIMKEYGNLESKETSNFILLVDRFFDCLNTRSLNEGIHKCKPDLLPYYHTDDSRFEFLQNEFLLYLEEWRKSVQNRNGNFSKVDRKKMFLSDQTYRGLCMTINSFIEVTKFLLMNGVTYVLSNVFCQDPIEEHFSRQRALGRRSDNPNLWTFGYQENKIRIQRTLALQINPKQCRGYKRKTTTNVTSSPLKRRKTKKS